MDVSNLQQDASITTLIAHGVAAIFGGLTNALNAQRNGKTKGLLDVIILTIISSFSGVVFAFVAMSMFDNLYITIAAAGSGGFLGVEGLAVIAKRAQDMIAKK